MVANHLLDGMIIIDSGFAPCPQVIHYHNDLVFLGKHPAVATGKVSQKWKLTAFINKGQ